MKQLVFETSSRNEMKLKEEVKNETMNALTYFVMEGSRKKRDRCPREMETVQVCSPLETVQE